MFFFFFYESKVLDTSLTEDVPRRLEEGGWETPVFGITVMVLLAEQTSGFGALLSCKYQFTAQMQQRIPVGVLYIYCTIQNRADILSSDHLFAR